MDNGDGNSPFDEKNTPDAGPGGSGQSPTPGGFESPPAQPPAPGGFEPSPAQPPAPSPFGQPPAQQPAPAQSPTPGPFGQPPAQPPAQAPAPSPFGKPPAQPAPAQSPTPSPFGQPPAQSPAPGGFEQPPAQSPAPGGFGQPPAQPPASGGFGSPPAQSPGGFGQPPAQSPGQSSGGFGSPPGEPPGPKPGGFRQPGGGGGFGQPASGFGPAPTRPPQQESKAPLYIGIGCGGLALTCVGCIVFGMIFGPSQEELEERRAEEAPQIEAQYERIGALATVPPHQADQAVVCPPELRSVQNMPAMRREDLVLFASGPIQTTGYWGWLSTLDRRDLEGQSSHEVHTLYTEFAEHPPAYLAVFEEGVALQPRVTGGGSFDGGLYIGTLTIMDIDAQRSVCSAPYAAENSENVMGSSSLQDLVDDDLERNTKTALEEALHSIAPGATLDTTPTIRG